MQESLILAIETASPAGGVAIVGEDLKGEIFLSSSETHSKRLLVSIRYLFERLSLSLEEIAGVAVSIGPGSFTGLRIGLATAKGLALGGNMPLMGVSTLEALAAQALYFDGFICPALDARRNQVYAALYRWSDDKTLETVWPPSLLTPEKLCSHIKGPTLFVGDALRLYGSLWQKLLGANFVPSLSPLRYPRAYSVGFLARQRFLAGKVDDPARLVPLYLRPSEAELKARRP